MLICCVVGLAEALNGKPLAHCFNVKYGDNLLRVVVDPRKELKVGFLVAVDETSRRGEFFDKYTIEDDKLTVGKWKQQTVISVPRTPCVLSHEFDCTESLESFVGWSPDIGRIVVFATQDENGKAIEPGKIYEGVLFCPFSSASSTESALLNRGRTVWAVCGLKQLPTTDQAACGTIFAKSPVQPNDDLKVYLWNTRDWRPLPRMQEPTSNTTTVNVSRPPRGVRDFGVIVRKEPRTYGIIFSVQRGLLWYDLSVLDSKTEMAHIPAALVSFDSCQRRQCPSTVEETGFQALNVELETDESYEMPLRFECSLRNLHAGINKLDFPADFDTIVCKLPFSIKDGRLVSTDLDAWEIRAVFPSKVLTELHRLQKEKGQETFMIFVRVRQHIQPNDPAPLEYHCMYDEKSGTKGKMNVNAYVSRRGLSPWITADKNRNLPVSSNKSDHLSQYAMSLSGRSAIIKQRQIAPTIEHMRKEAAVIDSNDAQIVPVSSNLVGYCQEVKFGYLPKKDDIANKECANSPIGGTFFKPNLNPKPATGPLWDGNPPSAYKPRIPDGTFSDRTSNWNGNGRDYAVGAHTTADDTVDELEEWQEELENRENEFRVHSPVLKSEYGVDQIKAPTQYEVIKQWAKNTERTAASIICDSQTDNSSIMSHMGETTVSTEGSLVDGFHDASTVSIDQNIRDLDETLKDEDAVKSLELVGICVGVHSPTYTAYVYTPERLVLAKFGKDQPVYNRIGHFVRLYGELIKETKSVRIVGKEEEETVEREVWDSIVIAPEECHPISSDMMKMGTIRGGRLGTRVFVATKMSLEPLTGVLISQPPQFFGNLLCPPEKVPYNVDFTNGDSVVVEIEFCVVRFSKLDEPYPRGAGWKLVSVRKYTPEVSIEIEYLKEKYDSDKEDLHNESVPYNLRVPAKLWRGRIPPTNYYCDDVAPPLVSGWCIVVAIRHDFLILWPFFNKHDRQGCVILDRSTQVKQKLDVDNLRLGDAAWLECKAAEYRGSGQDAFHIGFLALEMCDQYDFDGVYTKRKKVAEGEFASLFSKREVHEDTREVTLWFPFETSSWNLCQMEVDTGAGMVSMVSLRTDNDFDVLVPIDLLPAFKPVLKALKAGAILKSIRIPCVLCPPLLPSNKEYILRFDTRYNINKIFESAANDTVELSDQE